MSEATMSSSLNIDLIKRLESYQVLFNDKISKVFWSYFINTNVDTDKNNSRFTNAINDVHQYFTKTRDELIEFCNINNIQNKEIWVERLQNMLMASLIIDKEQSKRFNQILFSFFESEFVSFSKSYIGSMRKVVVESEELDDDDDDEINNNSSVANQDNEMIDISLNDSFTDISVKELMFMEICDRLSQLNFIIVSEDLVSRILLSKIHEYIDTKCRGEYERRLLKPILNWADNVIFKWLSMILSKSSGATFEQWKMRIEFSIYEYYSDQRIDELFNMIRLYPDSTPALQDLSICFQKISIQKTLVENLKKVFHQRLLHPGANTNDIITTYISCIQSMKIIDPSCIVMDQVGQPIKDYLANREDTIRCIVSSFTDETNEIYQEFSSGVENDDGTDQHALDIENCDVYLDDADSHMDFKSFESWQPASLESHPNQKKQKYKDTISSLVNIYESTDLFVNEYRLMLSERLLSMTDFDVDKEIENVELLKLRFGENSMHNCEIMIKDIQDSKRLNNQIGQQLREKQLEAIKFDTLILSELFWPSMKDEGFTYPKSLSSQMTAFSKEYEAIKAPRKLQWKQHLGFVELEIEINGQLKQLSVSPIHATIIMLFESKDRLSLSELADQLQIKEELVKKKLGFWVANQVLVEVERGVYETVKPTSTADGKSSMDVDNGGMEGTGSDALDVVVEDDEDEQQSASAREKEEQLKVIENFVFGMLNNFKTLPIDRIHTMLTMFNPENYSLTTAELKSFLQKLQNEERLEFSGGEYRIKK
ncbi:anaphase promoting complex subunit 2 [Heterostelium album PN500]|uniref:Anaphase-promoting complex subunit 2 n=1 Tax=Heterostelium pallidum (strain ATCC 26659 / Pp 5 / PN500) TaxID=670386 RepID=D3BDT3_HETP5|nr:anaphase promoting complex subunit 2 [Heterostelium album PN500]EFA80064.1 anaphase promoting complex subunit 2 [Heterostelium album PN500]|eukprot:XP_020432184.1 anaphase promoting complex subunit 2 [Heterostelium album PN500]